MQNTLIQRQVTRQEFLGILGLAAVSVFGFEHILKLLTGKSLDTHKALQNGYGSTTYGGKKD